MTRLRPRSRAGRRAALDRPAEGGSRAPVRLGPGEPSASARTGLGGRGHLDVDRGHPARAPYGLLGAHAEADGRQATARPLQGAWCRLAGAACATPSQAVPHAALANTAALPPTKADWSTMHP